MARSSKRKILSATRLTMAEIWEPGKGEFIDWLANNLSMLGEVLKMDLELAPHRAKTEAATAGLVAYDAAGDRTVLIQPQFNLSDEAMLGRLLTAAPAEEARVIIWLTETMRREHRDALEWLNARTSWRHEFFGLEAEVLGLGENEASLLFRPVVTPEGWTRDGRKIVEDEMPPERGYRTFWQGVIDILTEKQFLAPRSAWDRSMFTVTTGVPGAQYFVAFDEEDGRLHLGLHIDNKQQTLRKTAVTRLEGVKKSIEGDLAGFQLTETLSWSELPDTGGFWIGFNRDGSIKNDEAALDKLRDWSVERLVKFKYVFDKYLDDVFSPDTTKPGS